MKMVFRAILIYLILSLITGPAQAVTMGDVDSDGDIDSDDAALVLQNSLGAIEFIPEQKAAADVNGDGNVTAYDAALILRHASGYVDTFSDENGGQIESHKFDAQSTINVSVPNTSAPAGSSIAIPINVTDTTGAGIVVAVIALDYDPGILTATDVSTDGTIVPDWLPPLFAIISGQIQIVMTGLEALSGAGTLVKVIFTVSASASVGQTSPLTLSSVEFNNNIPTTTNGLFTVESPGGISITVVGPDGGENIKGGGAHPITWTTAGTGIDHVHLQYSINSGGAYQDIITNIPNDGSYEWNPVPFLDYSTMRVKAIAEASDNSELAVGESNDDFTIDSTPPGTNIYPSGIEGENGWWTSNVGVTLESTGDLSEIKWTKYKVNDGLWQVYSGTFYLTGSTVYYYSEDNAGNIEDEKSTQIKIDKDKPGTPVVTDDGDYTADGNQLHASWSSSDTGSGVVEYQYAIGTAPGGTNVVNWTSVGANFQVTKTGLDLIVGQTYYFSVQAKDEAGWWSIVGYSDGITYEAPQIGVSPSDFIFTAVAGGANPDDQILSITNEGFGTLNWDVSPNAAWLSLWPTSGDCTTETDEVTVSVNIGTLPDGIHNTSITITATGATSQTVPVVLDLSESARIGVSPPSLTFNAVEGGADPDDQILSVTNEGFGTLNWSVNEHVSWLDLSPLFGDCTTETDEVTVSVDIGTLPDGIYNTDITINDPDASNNPETVPVTLNVAEPLSITLFTPNGGEEIRGGDSYEITWIDTEAGVDHIHLQYSTSSGVAYQDIVADTPNDGSYLWGPVFTTINSSIVRVKAIAENASNAELSSDASDANLTIDSTAPVTIIDDLSGTPGEDDWWTSNVEVTLSATDNLTGVKQTEYRINDGSWQEYSGPFTVTGSYVYYRSKDNVGNLETAKSVEIEIDKTPPSTPVVTDDGDETPSTIQLHASWTSEDTESDVAEYQYAIGTIQGGTNVVDWTPVGTDTGVTATELILTDGQIYYFSVKARNGAGLWSADGYSDGITVNTSLGKEEKEIYFYPGWNLFSICLDVEDTDIPSILEEIEGEYISVWAYDRTPGTTTGIWRRYVPDGAPALNDLNAIEMGRGYWINMDSFAILTITGWPITDTAVQLYQGLNVVGYKSTETQSRQDALLPISGKYTYVSAYDGNWLRHVAGAPFLSNLSNLEPGYGYCIYVGEDCEWTLPSQF